jgi:hypothetical protein
VYGWIDFDQISPEYISKNFDREWKAQARKFPMDLPNMKRLYQAVDVIGVSGGWQPCSQIHCCSTCFMGQHSAASDRQRAQDACAAGPPARRLCMVVLMEFNGT